MVKSFLNIFRRTKQTRTMFFIFWDVLLISFSVWLAFFLRFEGEIPLQYWEGAIQATVALALIFCLPIFHFSRLYSFTWAYVSAQELISLIKALTLAFLGIVASFFLLQNHTIFFSYPRSVFLISYFLIFIFSGGIRFSKRIYMQIFKIKEMGSEETLIIGAGDAGEQILRSIQSSESPYFPIGFVDDNRFKQGSIIHGVKVLGRIEEIPKIVDDYQVKNLLIALPSVDSQTIKKTVELGKEAGVENIKILPSFAEILNGKISLADVREVQVEDLLGREKVSLDPDLIKDSIRGKRILVTGAAGSIGSGLVKRIADFCPLSILILDQDESGIFTVARQLNEEFCCLSLKERVCDICDKEKIDQVFAEFKPNIIFHAAAYKHVPLMEEQPEEAVKNNIFGTKILAEAAIKYEAERFIFISTDKAINPTSAMGATKRIGEMLCQVFNKKNVTKFVSVRFGNVLNSRGSVVPIFKEQIAKGGPIKVTHEDMKRYFMITSEACLLVMQAGAMGEGGEVFVLDMGKPVKILDLAKEMIRLSGFEPDKDIPIVFTGTRPGEKLFEELLSAEEGTQATQSKQIFIAELSDVSEKKLNSTLERLKFAAKKSNKQEIKNIFKEFVPYYDPGAFQD
ncbi:polysaccharide biosynthesis protein [Candidatus Parcubacteria bacterium]|nr:polysaccharide biosynthesis protein [Candidatus Parcubacteria bacterium]